MRILNGGRYRIPGAVERGPVPGEAIRIMPCEGLAVDADHGTDAVERIDRPHLDSGEFEGGAMLRADGVAEIVRDAPHEPFGDRRHSILGRCDAAGAVRVPPDKARRRALDHPARLVEQQRLTAESCGERGIGGDVGPLYGGILDLAGPIRGHERDVVPESGQRAKREGECVGAERGEGRALQCIWFVP